MRIMVKLVKLAPCPSWVALTGEEEPGGMEALRTCGRGEEEFARGKHPRGVILFKNSVPGK